VRGLAFALCAAGLSVASCATPVSRLDLATRPAPYFGAELEPKELPAHPLGEADRALWMSAIKRSMMKPGCCGACAPFDIEDARLVWSYVTAGGDETRSFESREAWFRHWRRLANEFAELDSQRFGALYGPWPR